MSNSTHPSTRKVIRIRDYDDDPTTVTTNRRRPASQQQLAAGFAATPFFYESELHLHQDQDSVEIIPNKKHSASQQQQSASSTIAPLRRILHDLFFPIGFPQSVADGYFEYQCYDSLQGLCSYLRGVLCSAQVLQAAGVGSASATALSAARTWALKDGASMLGGLLFSYSSAHMFDSYVKEFRLFADLINDVGLTLDMLAPYFGQDYFLWVSSAAGICRALCGLSAGATKSSITQHFAREGNMADLNAKEATQETLVSLMGMILGVTLASTAATSRGQQ
jgi:hypothetical protein